MSLKRTKYIRQNTSYENQVKGGASTIAFSATPSFDMDNGNYQEMPVTGNVTSIAITNTTPGSMYSIVLIVGSGGPFTIAQAGASFGTRTNNSVDDSEVNWYPVAQNSLINYDIRVSPSGVVYYSIETLGS